jgi:hypothetical protein
VPVRSLAALAAAVVATAAVPAGAPAVAAADAATVNDVSISIDEFEEFVGALSAAGLQQYTPSADAQTLDGDAGRALLSVLVANEARGQFLADIGEEPVSDEELEAVYGQLAADHPLQALEGGPRQAVAADQVYVGRLDALAVPDADILRQRYEESAAGLGVYCATAVSVASREDGEAVVRAVAGGATAEEAAAGVDGGVSDWQCTPVASVVDPVLVDSLAAAEPGDAVGPVSTTDGLVVLVLDTFEQAEPKLENFFLRLEDGGQTSAGFVLFQGFLLGADVTVNPRFGRWDPTSGSVVALGA